MSRQTQPYNRDHGSVRRSATNSPARGLAMISAILLAAGESRRMGQFKQLLPLGDKTFVEHCLDSLLASRVDEVVVVTGYRQAEVRNAIGKRAARFVFNPAYQSGMASTIKTGVEALSKNALACLIALVDQPRVATDAIDLLIGTYEEAKPLIVIPTYEGKNGHPVLIDLKLKEEILTMDLGEGLREVIRRHSSQIVHVEVGNRAVLEDCDLPEDYQRLLKD
jgi:molybdenum cofactor cytidylyltransferase